MKTDPWARYRNIPPGYHPRTPNSALLALLSGIIQVYEFIELTLSIQAINIQPWDLNEIDRVLARKDLEIDTILVLLPVLHEILKEPDRERALSAAESLGTLEHRYLSRVENLRRALEVLEPSPDRQEAFRLLVLDLFELGLMSTNLGSLKNYYLHEALSTSLNLEKEYSFNEADILLRIRLLGELNLHQQVQDILNQKPYTEIISPHELKKCRAANAFYRKDFLAIHGLLDNVDGELCEFWSLEGCRDDDHD